jgi:hypothetical protein
MIENRLINIERIMSKNNLITNDNADKIIKNMNQTLLSGCEFLVINNINKHNSLLFDRMLYNIIDTYNIIKELTKDEIILENIKNNLEILKEIKTKNSNEKYVMIQKLI